MNFLSTNLKFLRTSKKLTQEDVARVVNKSRVLVSQWESDSREMTTDDIIKLSSYFNIPMDDFIGKDLRIEKPADELEVLFSKNRDILTKDDEDYIRFIIDKRKKEIDEQIERGV